MSESTGFAALPIVVIDDERLTSADLNVLMSLSCWLGCDEVWPSQAAIAKRAHCSIDTVARALRHLRELGLVEWEQRHKPDGGQTSNVYRLLTASWGDPHLAAPPLHDAVPPPAESVTPSSTVRDEVSKKKEPKKKEPLLSEAAPSDEEIEDRRLCNLLADLIEANGSKRPQVIKSWLDAVRLMRTRDSRTVEQIEWLIKWSQNDEFWRTNILSMPKFRQNFDTMRLRVIAKRDGTANGNAPPRREYRGDPDIDPSTFTPIGVPRDQHGAGPAGLRP